MEIKKGNIVRIKGDNNLYIIDKTKSSKAERHQLEIKSVDNPNLPTLKIHKSRIAKVQVQGEFIQKEKKMTQEKKERKPKKNIVVIPFDLKQWVNKDEHYVKKCTFDHKNIVLEAHIVIREHTEHTYECLNIYVINGIYSLGKKNKGGTIFPLKGHTTTITQKGITKTLIGEKTAEDVRETAKKNKYDLETK